MALTEALKKLLIEKGAALVGFADLSVLKDSEYKCGISVVVPMPKEIVSGIIGGPTDEYFEAYYESEKVLDQIVLAGEEYLLSKGYHTYAQIGERMSKDKQWRSKYAHKTIATCAGIGWVGKSCLLITKEYGSAVRLSSILTDAPLDCAEPICESKCGDCRRCVEACPAQAIRGIAWDVTVETDRMLNKEICREKQKELTKQATGREKEFLCGTCFAVCPYTQRYVRGISNEK